MSLRTLGAFLTFGQKTFRSATLGFIESLFEPPVIPDIVQEGESLLVGVNSFGTFGKLMTVAADMPELEQFHQSTETDLVKALKESWVNIGNLRLDMVRLKKGFSDSIRRGSIPSSSIYLEKDDIEALSKEGILALLRAQCAETEFLLGGDPVEKRRLAGFISDSSGESTQFFRSSKPLTLPVSRSTAEALKGYVRWTSPVSR